MLQVVVVVVNMKDMYGVQVKERIAEYNRRGKPVAGLIVEPIQGEGGDNHASPEFFRELQQICLEVWCLLTVLVCTEAQNNPGRGPHCVFKCRGGEVTRLKLDGIFGDEFIG